MRGIGVIFTYALRESLRRKVFHAVLVLTSAFLVLYWLGTRAIAREHGIVDGNFGDGRLETIVAAVVLGLAIFVFYFLGVALAIFLTLAVVRGDAETGLLQPLVVRPLTRFELLAGRLLAAVAVSGTYVAFMIVVAVVITDQNLGWSPHSVPLIAFEVGAAVSVVAAISLLGSVFLSGMANGIGVFMLFGAGLFGALLGQIGSAIPSRRLENIAEVIRYVTPFEWIYQDALGRLIESQDTITERALSLGPFGGSVEPGLAVWGWSALFVAAVFGGTWLAFSRKDL